MAAVHAVERAADEGARDRLGAVRVRGAGQSRGVVYQSGAELTVGGPARHDAGHSERELGASRSCDFRSAPPSPASRQPSSCTGAAAGRPTSSRGHRGLRRAADVGWAVLTAGGSALDAVQAAVVALEDDPVFNAGVGSSLTAGGTVEMDASLMDGATQRGAASPA